MFVREMVTEQLCSINYFDPDAVADRFDIDVSDWGSDFSTLVQITDYVMNKFMPDTKEVALRDIMEYASSSMTSRNREIMVNIIDLAMEALNEK